MKHQNAVLLEMNSIIAELFAFQCNSDAISTVQEGYVVNRKVTLVTVDSHFTRVGKVQNVLNLVGSSGSIGKWHFHTMYISVGRVATCPILLMLNCPSATLPAPWTKSCRRTLQPVRLEFFCSLLSKNNSRAKEVGEGSPALQIFTVYIHVYIHVCIYLQTVV